MEVCKVIKAGSERAYIDRRIGDSKGFTINHDRRGKVSLAALYGQKPAQIQDYLSSTQRILATEFGRAFRPYAMEQVHATIIGLEGRRDSRSSRIINKNFEELVGKPSAMDINRVADLTSSLFAKPVAVQFGGYDSNAQYGFTSRGVHPYERSFSIQGTTAIIMGWPICYGEDQLTLDRLRRRFLDANALHRYHTDPSVVDNDLYLVVGHVDRKEVSDDRVFAATSRAREFAAQHPIHVSIERSDLSIVSYEETTLHPATSVAYRVPVSADQLAALY